MILRRLVVPAFIGGMVLFLVAPILVVIPMSFTAGDAMDWPPQGFSLRWYSTIFTDPAWTTRIPVSVQVGVGSAFVATVLGTLAALGTTRGRFRGKGLVTALFLTPLVVPVVALGLGVYFTWALGWHIGPIGFGGGLLGSVPGLILAHTVLGLPYPYVTVMTSLRGVDPNLDLAAASLGAPPWRTFFSVTLPLISPGVISGAVFAFLVSWDEVVIATFLSSPRTSTVPVEVYAQVRDSISPAAAAISCVLLLVSVVLISGIGLLSKKRGQSSTTSKK